MVGVGFSKEVLRGSWLGKAVEESGPVGGSCKPKGPEVGTSWVCSRNRKEVLTVGPFTSLQTAPQPPEAQLLMHGGQEPMPQLGYKYHSLLTAPVFASLDRAFQEGRRDTLGISLPHHAETGSSSDGVC